MAIKLKNIKPGDRLFQVRTEKLGNTNIRQQGVYAVDIISIDHVAGYAMVRWNGNPARRWNRYELERLYRFAPEWLRQSLVYAAKRYRCHHCRATSSEKNSANHKPNCPHPRAVAYRKKRGG